MPLNAFRYSAQYVCITVTMPRLTWGSLINTCIVPWTEGLTMVLIIKTNYFFYSDIV